MAALLKLKELAGDSDLLELERQSVSQDFEDKISNTTLLYNKYNIRELATTEMRNYSEKAFNALSALAVPEERKRELILLLYPSLLFIYLTISLNICNISIKLILNFFQIFSISMFCFKR